MATAGKAAAVVRAAATAVVAMEEAGSAEAEPVGAERAEVV